MQPIATDGVAWSVSMSVMTISPAKKWLNSARCHLACELRCTQGTMY